MRTSSTAAMALAAGCDGAAPFGPTANAISARGSAFDAQVLGACGWVRRQFADAGSARGAPSGSGRRLAVLAGAVAAFARRREEAMSSSDARAKVPLSTSLAVQLRVIRALMIREAQGKYSVETLGFFWVIAEPLILTCGVIALWLITDRGKGHGDVSIVALALTAYSHIQLWRLIVLPSIHSIRNSGWLLYHHNVHVIDVHCRTSYVGERSYIYVFRNRVLSPAFYLMSFRRCETRASLLRPGVSIRYSYFRLPSSSRASANYRNLLRKFFTR